MPVARAWLRAGIATLCALLMSRLLLLLFAARPDNAAVTAIVWLTDVLVWPLAWIDNLQPVYGARFERGTLLEVVLCLCVLWWLRRTPD